MPCADGAKLACIGSVATGGLAGTAYLGSGDPRAAECTAIATGVGLTGLPGFRSPPQKALLNLAASVECG